MAWIELIDLEGEPCTLTMLSDMTERHWAAACQSTQFTVTRILAEADTIEEALPGVLETICQKFGWHAGEMWQLDSSTSVLRRGCTWYAPELATTSFVTLAASIALQCGEGLAGICWQQGETLWLRDMGATAAAACQHSAAAQQVGLNSAIFCPVRTPITFDGVMCFFSYRVREYDAMLAETMTDIGSQVSQFLHRKQTEEALAIERASLKQRVAQATLELSRMNAELSRAMRAKDEFLATMSHELRTPLNAVLGLTESLQEQIYGPLTERQLKSLRTIEASSRHLLTLINDILDVSKIEAGKLELQFDILSVETLCETSMLFIQQQALQKSIHVSRNLECAPHTIEGDARRLKQILINLLSNAVKFTPEGGKVGLDVTSSEGDDIIHFTVWDTGIGIAPEYQRKLFKPFVQLDSSLSKAHQGTGLGLALVARLTELHNGSVALQSELGAGSRFTISLPMSAPAMAEQGAATSATEPPTPLTTTSAPGTDEAGYTATPGDTHLDDGRSTLLIAEDNEHTIQMLQSYLEEVGYRVVVARNGVEAIIRATEEPPALILMDMQMPEMSGMEALHSLRATPRFASIPIIAMTALAMSGDRERCLLAGANEYLSKPVSLKRLRMMIEAMLLDVRAPTS
jgi:signal transduction histidine kinase/ActR/RegA family two-component response regulator